MKSQTFHRTARGLFSQFNRIHGMPEGALLEAENVTIDREGVVSKARGRARYGAAASGDVLQLLEYKDRILRHVGSVLEYDSDGAGTWAAYTGDVDPPDSMNKVRSAEALLSLYLTSEFGILKKATLADDPVYSGIHEGLDLELLKTGSGDGMFTVDSAVAYRVVFGRVDANDKDLVGAPTWRETLTNTENTGLAWTNSGTTVTVTQTAHGYSSSDFIEISDSGDANIPDGSYQITKINDNSYSFTSPGTAGGSGTLTSGKLFNIAILASVPPDIVEGDFFRVYRTEFSATATTAAGDEMKLVQEVPVSSTHISDGWVTFTDTRDEAFLGENLYTNALEEGATAENGRPPWAADATLWKGHLWYFNCRQPPSLEITLLTTSTLSTTAGDWLEITSEGTTRRYFSHSAEDLDPGNLQFAVWGAGPGEAINVEKTMKSFCRIVNRDSGQSLWTAKYVSGEDDIPGIVEIRKVRANSGSLSIICDQTSTGILFTPELPTSGTTVQTKENWDRNGLYRSKFEQAESVPIGSFDPIGSEYYRGLRALGLRDSLILLTQKGIFRVSGESDGSAGDTFFITELDPSIHVVAPDAAAIVDNSVYCLSTQGVVRIDEAGTDLMSHPVEDDLKKLFVLSGYEDRCFAVGYEQEHRYILYRPEKASDTQATIAEVWNYVTQTWTRRRRTMSSAQVLFNEELLFEGDAIYDYVLRERKTYATDLSDYQDESVTSSISTVTSTTNTRGETVSQLLISYQAASVLPMQPGFHIIQGTAQGVVERVTQSTSITYIVELDTLGNFSTGSATLSMPINSRVRWRPEAAGNPGVETHFIEVALYMEANLAKEHVVGFASNVEESEQQLDPHRIDHLYGWGEMEWGDDGWGDEDDPGSTPVRVDVPYPYSRCSALSVSYEHKRARETFDVASLAYTIRAVGEKTTQGPRS